MRDFGPAGPRAVPPLAWADAAAASPPPLCRPPCSAAGASRVLFPPCGFQRSGRRQQFGLSKKITSGTAAIAVPTGNNRCSPHPRRGSFKIPPTPTPVRLRCPFLPPPPLPRRTDELRLPPPTPDSGLFCSLSPSSLGLGSLQKVSWVGWE